jgi:hypothetical protein
MPKLCLGKKLNSLSQLWNVDCLKAFVLGLNIMDVATLTYIYLHLGYTYSNS